MPFELILGAIMQLITMFLAYRVHRMAARFTADIFLDASSLYYEASQVPIFTDIQKDPKHGF